MPMFVVRVVFFLFDVRELKALGPFVRRTDQVLGKFGHQNDFDAAVPRLRFGIA